MNYQNNEGVAATNLKPNKPDVYGGRRDFLTVNTKPFNIDQYLKLAQLSSPNIPLAHENLIRFV